MRLEKSDVADLVGEQPRFQVREWRIDRGGWVVMFLIVLAGLLGLWGGGPLGEATVSAGDGSMSVSYDRFVRNLGESTLIAEFPPGSAEADSVSLAVDQAYLTSNQVQSITPEPDTVTARNGRFVYEFPAAADTSLTVRFDLRPSSGAGVRTATIESGSGGQARLWQFVYP
ncbi:hypothetical protein SAMN05216266_10642 [Amycolatopsis marina]|uniref:Uncharacterized protein n=1 Tax=Amycolatopsis marina TaxID=490629 RepID=A0A1I0Z1C6_9PSEU|nr:hypothetical protein [Amycolatopsis marina]SFB19519.1 hypothetical protein SAMN05216266_10642 [Amycolatopsis marina]